ncbi:MAG: EAL domain-containing protein [Actinobacteria bacterium]|nr:MAG: EAL domain-containing protein [Actinomycetota bacterium]
MVLAPTTSRWDVVTGPRARAGYVAAIITAAAFWCLGRWDLVNPLSPLQLVVLFGGGNLFTKFVAVWCRARASYARALIRIASETALITIVMYATGWGPVLAVGYMFLVHDVVGDVGARAWRIVLVCALTGIALGQLAIAANIAPSFIAAPRVHGLASLGALGLAFAVRMFGRATEEKEHARQTVVRSERRMSALVQNASDIIIVLDRDRSFVYVSPAIERILGAPAESYLGPDHVEMIHPDDLDTTREVMLEAIEHPGRQVRTELRVQHHDGSWRWMEASLVNLLDEPAVGGIVVNLHDVTDRRHQALHDMLTGLPNRASLAERLRQSIAWGRARDAQWALLLLDVDRFREVNDTFGHHNGDKLLREIGARVSGMLGERDVVARLGGDEFAVLWEVEDEAGVLAFAARVLDELRRPVAVEGMTLCVDASIGVVFVSDNDDDLDDLLARADVAMYVAKTTHSGCELYDMNRDQSSVGRTAMAGELRRALDGRELIVHYQPKVELATGRVIGAEALVRWQHPRHGLVLPDKFVPVAEQTGLIDALSRYVLAAALGECRRWREAGFDMGVAVNLSTRNLVDVSLPDDVRLLLAEAEIAPASLDLEITESALLADPLRAADVVRRLSALGVRIAIDDFGTGYSSLAHLRRLLVSEIKIDKSFVTTMAANADDAIIVRSTIELAHSLGLRVVAEGIESKVVCEQLRALGCDIGQGYYLGPPVASAELMDWLWDQHRLAEGGIEAIASR